MESIKLFGGYGKVNPHLEDQSPHQQQSASKRRILILSVASILLLTLIIGIALASLIHESNSEPDESPYLSSSNPAESIKTAALKDCVSQFDDSLSKLNDSLSAMEVGPGEKMLNLEKVNDIQTWISAAMTDQDTCIDGLEEMGSKFLDEIKAKIERSKEFLSISLAIIAKMQALLEKFDQKMH
ncbi:pectinesterase 3-like [Populus alba x Populus x berolinensis]|uniref:pectinesterase n=1 Tax=Populus alba x Populus x berolinensis TaxID=444605 RepID=A0AAD6RKY5_9ROSI|nr:pectinesterase 3-like [Populus alba x Populus x berolinensis]